MYVIMTENLKVYQMQFFKLLGGSYKNMHNRKSKEEKYRKWLALSILLLVALVNNTPCATNIGYKMFAGEWALKKDAARIGVRAAQWSLVNQMDNLSYQNVCTAYGILMVAKATGNRELIRGIEKAFQPYLLDNKNTDRDNAEIQKAHQWFGFIPLELYRQTKNLKYLKRGIELAERQYENANADGMPEYTSRWYVDDIYGATTMQSLAYSCTGEKKYLERAIKQVLTYANRLQNDEGLFYHGPESKFNWGRGIGWCAAAFAELLSVMPETHPERDKVLTAYRLLMKALGTYQGPEGMWHQLVDDRESWPEASCTGMFLYSMSQGVNKGWLPYKGYGADVKKAWRALAGYVDEQGRLKEVCVGTGRGNTREYYMARPRQTGDPHGQAGLLWAASSIINR
jgi:unsaturated rhamnogalacturonyl hydrolase